MEAIMQNFFRILLYFGLVVCLFLSPIVAQEFPYFQYNDIVALGRASTATDLADMDKDGDLDWITTIHSSKEAYWFENLGNLQWKRHYMGKAVSYDGGKAWDINGDGWLDYTVGSTVFINPGNPKYHLWTNSHQALVNEHSHDHVPADINGDGKLDLVTTSDVEGINWFEVPENPLDPWKKHNIIPSFENYTTHGALAPAGVADIDGDGDNDVAGIDSWWENTEGTGLSWERHQNIQFGQAGPWGYSSRTWCTDLDGDGDVDVVMSEADVKDGRLAWFENINGQGTWKRHLLKDKGERYDLHTLGVADFDNDGDLDIMVGATNLGVKPFRTLIFENQAGKGQNPKASQWKEHVIYSGFESHEGVVGDIDNDGDLDIVSKEYDEQPNKHYVLKNMLMESKPSGR